MKLSDTDLHIWNIDFNESEYYLYLSLYALISSEQDRVDKFKRFEDKISFIITHISLKILLFVYTDISIEKIKYKFNNYGKPSLDDKYNINYNISYSYKKAVIALSKNIIGIDIEYINKKFQYEEISKLVLSEKEILKVNNSSFKFRSFYSLWTRKEAFLKALGVGLNDNLKALDVCNINKNYRTLGDHKITEWRILGFKIFDPNYIGHVAYQKLNTCLKVKYFNISDHLKFFLNLSKVKANLNSDYTLKEFEMRDEFLG